MNMRLLAGLLFAVSVVGFSLGASLPLVSITAWEALITTANLSAGQRVLILAGAGGVGSIAVQLAKALGVEL